MKFHNHQRHSRADFRMGCETQGYTSFQKKLEKKLAARKRRQRDKAQA